MSNLVRDDWEAVFLANRSAGFQPSPHGGGGLNVLAGIARSLLVRRPPGLHDQPDGLVRAEVELHPLIPFLWAGVVLVAWHLASRSSAQLEWWSTRGSDPTPQLPRAGGGRPRRAPGGRPRTAGKVTSEDGQPAKGSGGELPPHGVNTTSSSFGAASTIGTVKSRTAVKASMNALRRSLVHPEPLVGTCWSRPTRPGGRPSGTTGAGLPPFGALLLGASLAGAAAEAFLGGRGAFRRSGGCCLSNWKPRVAPKADKECGHLRSTPCRFVGPERLCDLGGRVHRRVRVLEYVGVNAPQPLLDPSLVLILAANPAEVLKLLSGGSAFVNETQHLEAVQGARLRSFHPPRLS